MFHSLFVGFLKLTYFLFPSMNIKPDVSVFAVFGYVPRTIFSELSYLLFNGLEQLTTEYSPSLL